PWPTPPLPNVHPLDRSVRRRVLGFKLSALLLLGYLHPGVGVFTAISLTIRCVATASVPSRFRGCVTGSLPLLFSEPLVVRVSSPRLSLSIVIFDSVHEPGAVYFASGPITT
ncbi:hypothetical protein B0H14DRAFT_2733354, partial [Mycena olivaceomarginata]